MEEMLDEYLDFARGQASEETARSDLVALARETVEDAVRHGGQVELVADGPVETDIRAGTVKRSLANLVTNALTFGKKARVTVRRAGTRIEIVVEDDGPGIPEDRYEEALKPFNRLDESRNMNRKGVGLGLAIARDVARNHGGDIRLGKSDMGGLQAVLSLPG
jgi:two-component system osmolarity sensor histidine kinase EnvZ